MNESIPKHASEMHEAVPSQERCIPSERRLMLLRLSKCRVVMHLFGKIKEWFYKRWIFSLVVLLPTALVALYLCFIAAPQYVSEAHFLVRGRSLNGSSLGGVASLLESNHGGSQDTYAVQDYMLSRDALRMLSRVADIKAVFKSPCADFLARFPSIFTREDFESFYAYYRRHVWAQIDEETGISHLRVRSFSAKDSQRIAQVLLDAAEKLVNEMNDRQRYNTLHAAQVELSDSLKELHDTELQMAAYRYANNIIDPTKQAIPMTGMELSLETTLAMVEAEKKQLDVTAPHSPLGKVYKQRIVSIQNQLKKAQAHITGRGDNSSTSLVPKILDYDELEIKKSLLEKKLAVETSTLEMAKVQANRQMLYVTVIAQPNLPDYASYPNNIVFLLIVFFTCLGVYITGALLVSGAREHAL